VSDAPRHSETESHGALRGRGAIALPAGGQVFMSSTVTPQALLIGPVPEALAVLRSRHFCLERSARCRHTRPSPKSFSL
jgi:hypothetical protein